MGMRFRVGLLIGLLALRLLFNWIWSLEYRQGERIRVTGNIVKVSQSNINCVARVDRFWVEFPKYCSFSRASKVRLFGRVRGDLIDRALARVYLDEGEIEVLEVTGREAKSSNERLNAGLTSWREKMIDIFQANLPEPEASLVSGIVLGAKSDLPVEFYQALLKSGTVHLVVASGYNVMVLGGTILSLLLFLLNRRVAVIVTIGGLMIYTGVAGFGAPIIRAVIMGSLVYISGAIGRRSSGLWSLGVAIWVMVMIDPQLLESVSFQLTVAAALGIFWLEPMMTDWVAGFGWGWLQTLAKTELAPTLSAQALTAPIIWWHFARISLVAPLSNMLILPLVPTLMALGGIMLLVGMIVPPLATAIAWPTYALAHLMVVMVELFGK